MTQKEEIPQTEPAEIEQLIEQVKQSNLEQSAVDKLERLLRLILRLVELLQHKNVSLKRLRTMVFGPRTEKRKTSDRHQEEEKKEETAGGVAGSEAKSEAGEKIETDEGAVEQRKPAGKGHGRRPAAAYRGAKIVECRHQQLKAGDQCPDPGCEGRLYQYYRPNNFIQFTGRPMLEVSQYKREVLRCAHCQERYPAPLPEGVTGEKYTATADATIALVKYGGGQPWYRLSGLLESMGVPFSESVMWERCEAVANAGLPVFLLLKRMAGDGEVLSIDDTGLTILEWEMEKQKLAARERRGTQMSGIVVKSGRRKIALYAGGRNHAGENVAELLSQRSPKLKLPIIMSDALAANEKGEEPRISAKCWAHARRKFFEIAELFPEQCRIVLDAIGQVYQFESETRGMSAEERLQYHQEHSEPVLMELKQWIKEQLQNRQVEPNSALGEAMRYTLRHWEGLTKFLTVEHCPIDNNEVERALKRFVLFRKNSLFFKTEHGADCGSIIMTLIESCRLNGRDPWAYLVILRKNAVAARKNPELFLPWDHAEAESEPRAA